MHEYSITCSIIKILERITKEKKVDKVNQVDFEVNEYASIEPESVKFYYEFLTKDNAVLKDAKLNFKILKANVFCNDCRTVFSTDIYPFVCPKCGSVNIKFQNLDNIKITALHTE